MGEVVKCKIKVLPMAPHIFEGHDLLCQSYDWLMREERYYGFDRNTLEKLKKLFGFSDEIAKKVFGKYKDNTILNHILEEAK